MFDAEPSARFAAGTANFNVTPSPPPFNVTPSPPPAPCAVLNCAVCGQDSQCRQCDIGYELRQNGTCARMPMPPPAQWSMPPPVAPSLPLSERMRRCRSLAPGKKVAEGIDGSTLSLECPAGNAIAIDCVEYGEGWADAATAALLSGWSMDPRKLSVVAATRMMHANCGRRGPALPPLGACRPAPMQLQLRR